MVSVAALCFRAIEQLFIPPLDAAREKATHDVQALILTMEQLRVVSEAVGVFRSGMPVDDSPGTITTVSKTKRVEQLALAAGVSMSTMWRRVQKGEVQIED